MNIRVNRGEFLKAVRITEKAISDNKIRPVISCMYLETIGVDKIILKGTNLELTITSEMNCSVVEGGSVVFSYQLVEEYLREISDTEVNLSIENNLLTIKTSDSESEFTTMDVSEYPKVSGELVGEKQKFSRERFVEMLERTKFAASVSTDNLAINCVRMDIIDNKIKMIATDTYRLVYLEDEIECSETIKASIPLNTVEALIKALKSLNDEEIEFAFRENQIAFKMGDTHILSRVIGLEFPNYQGIMDGVSYNKEIKVDVDEVIRLLKRVQIFVKNNNESKYSAIFNINGSTLSVNGASEIAKINEELEVDYSDEDLKISLNVKFLLDFIQYLDRDKRLIIDLLSSSSAVSLKNEDDDRYLYIAMPLALRD